VDPATDRDAGVAEVALNPMGTYLRSGAAAALADVALVRDAYADRVAARPARATA
jgi:hypothetical protein